MYRWRLQTKIPILVIINDYLMMKCFKIPISFRKQNLKFYAQLILMSNKTFLRIFLHCDAFSLSLHKLDLPVEKLAG